MKRILFFGGNRKNESYPLLKFAIDAKKRGHEVIIFTEDLHLNMLAGNGKTLKQYLDEEGLEYIKVKEISKDMVSKYIDNRTTGLLVNAIWLVRQEVIDLFGGRLYNYHNARLPEERGAAAYSWKILSQSRKGGLAIHKVEKKFDTGDIVICREFIFPEECRIPADYYLYMNGIEDKLFSEFMDKVDSGGFMPARKQIENNSFYWPRLNTDANGYINWDWSARDVELFINAFDDPYEGASTFIEGRKVRIKKCVSEKVKNNFHPFQAGIVFRQQRESIFVICNGGYLTIKDVFDEHGKRINDKIRLGSRFYTPYSYLEEAKAVKIIHKHDGIQVKEL